MPTARSKDLEKAARVFHALSDGTRLRILQRLQAGEQCVCDLTDVFQTGQSRTLVSSEGIERSRPCKRSSGWSLDVLFGKCRRIGGT